MVLSPYMVKGSGSEKYTNHICNRNETTRLQKPHSRDRFLHFHGGGCCIGMVISGEVQLRSSSSSKTVRTSSKFQASLEQQCNSQLNNNILRRPLANLRVPRFETV